MLKIIFTIPEEVVTYIQRFGFELEGRKRIVQEITISYTGTDITAAQAKEFNYNVDPETVEVIVTDSVGAAGCTNCGSIK